MYVNHIYATFPASSYGRGTEFDTETREFATSMRFDWKFSYAPVNLDIIDVELNDSPEQTFDLVDAAMENGELSLIDDISTQLFADGTGNTSQDMSGLAIAVSRTGTYGGITRGTTAPGSEIRAAVEDTTGGPLALASTNSQMQTCTVAKKKPDLLVTTQTLWNRIWERSQPSERTQMANAGDARDIGFDFVRFNGAKVVVDTHCPTGFLYYLNTEYFELRAHRRWDFRFRGPMEPTNQQRAIGQLIFWGELICRAPRFQGVASGLT
jgi:hypothetical protein